MDWKTTLLIAVSALGLVAVFLGRFELVSVPAGGEGRHGVAYRLDRWTGEVAFVRSDYGGRIEIK
jgi:hypothetical protein